MQLSIQLAPTNAKCVLVKEDHNNENKGGLKLFHKDKQIALPQKAMESPGKAPPHWMRWVKVLARWTGRSHMLLHW